MISSSAIWSINIHKIKGTIITTNKRRYGESENIANRDCRPPAIPLIARSWEKNFAQIIIKIIMHPSFADSKTDSTTRSRLKLL